MLLSSRHRQKQRLSCYRPTLEELESRCLLSFNEFSIPTPASDPNGITAGPDGNLWFCEDATNQLGILTPQGQFVQEVPLPTPESTDPDAIVLGPKGDALWFTEDAGNRIGRIDPQTYEITEFLVPTPSSKPEAIAAGPDGNIWFTELDANKIGRITPEGEITEFEIPLEGWNLFGIKAGPDGNIWFTEAIANQIGKLDPQTGAITEYPIPTPDSTPTGITAGPDGNIWFNETGANQIGRITPDGQVTEFAIPTPDSGPFNGILTGPDGNIWFTETNGNQLGKMDPMNPGEITEFSVPTPDSFPNQFTVGPDGNLWFDEEGSNQVGQFVFDQAVPIGWQTIRSDPGPVSVPGDSRRLDTPINERSPSPDAAPVRQEAGVDVAPLHRLVPTGGWQEGSVQTDAPGALGTSMGEPLNNLGLQEPNA